MGVFPEPAPCADDACRLVPETGTDEGEAAVRWLIPQSAQGRKSRKARVVRTLTGRVLTALGIGLALAGALPQDALAPAAAAHDRADLQVPRRSALPPMGTTEWRGLVPVQEKPSTAELIQLDLDRLASEAGEDQTVVFDTLRVPRALVDTILRAAKETEVDPVYLMALADKESSFRPNAQAATSSAEGLFQFLTGTWLELVRSFGARHGLTEEAGLIQRHRGGLTVPDAAARRRILALRRDPYVASLMAGEMMKRDRARIEQRLGRDLKQTECYVAHLLGVASASRFMQLTQEKPDQPAQTAFRAAARANRSLFFERQGKKTRSLTVAEVYERLDLMIDRRLDRFQSAAALADRIDTRRPGDAIPAEATLVP
ncbi:transglycosylase SLT domain-containing protein [Methylobacterium nodulans]|uniref:Lytic transglycosylase catalytic n=1 Tax=Methylobacterium nodulans (strain LMG 21967 / CNCM I-2342 / ORS 2060) TaxID=460265 RepID=B8IAW7_METNO|nr:transglycosylase SLT domain-containing protein [Methylobacterium nodulans]ACL55360.1 Lytic transglycosylase catalytic [Methylobacterium nodulans ORS 2060]